MWKITRDSLEGRTIRVQSRTWDDDKARNCPLYRFRLLDDDRIPYYYGVSTNDSSFGPLDSYGAPNAGCTRIEYLIPGTGKYEAL